MIKAENIRKFYGTGDRRSEILKGISMEIERGSFTVMLGASGSVKSTLLNVLSGLERTDEGSVLYDGENIEKLTDSGLTEFRKRKIGFIFQQYYLLPNLNVDKNVKMGAQLGGNKDYREIIKALGLAEKSDKYPNQLSGGEQQRVAVARALAKKPEVLFLDEPTGALDEETGRQVLDCISELRQKSGFTIIMVTHNANIAQMAQRVIKMNSGKIAGEYENKAPKTAYEIGW